MENQEQNNTQPASANTLQDLIVELKNGIAEVEEIIKDSASCSSSISKKYLTAAAKQLALRTGQQFVEACQSQQAK